MKCLIVEDNAAMRRLLRRFVMEHAIDVYESSNGLEAINQYAQVQPDCVLMDIELPGQNGLHATRQIKAIYPQANILIVTSYDDPELRQAAQVAGACGYVLKENLQELRSWLIRRVAAESTLQRDLPRAEKGSLQ